METTPLLCRYVSFLRALYLLHQNNHWLSSGDAFYAQHLLFERIYQSAAENADAAAEKVIGVFGPEAIALDKQNEEINSLLKSFASESNHLMQSLKAENSFQEFSQEIFDKLEESDQLSLGMNDLIATVANERESAIYLLKRNLGNQMTVKQSQINQLANKFIRKLAQETNVQQEVPVANPQPGQGGVSSLNIDSVGDQVKGDLRSTLGLKEDLDFSTLRMVTDPVSGKASISWGLQVPANLVKEYNDAVNRKRQSEPNFSVPRFIVSLFNKYAPGTAVLPAQPISIG